MFSVFTAFRACHRVNAIRLAQPGAVRAARLGALGATCLGLAIVGCGGTALKDGPEGTGASPGAGGTGGTGGSGGTTAGNGGGGTGGTGGTGAGGTGATGGISHVPETPHDFEGEIQGVTFEDGHFVAVGEDMRDGTAEYSRSKVLILTSEDGRRWQRQAEGQEGSGASVAFGGGVWVSVGAHAWVEGASTVKHERYVFTSPDAVTWTAQNAPPTATLDQVVWTGREFLTTVENKLLYSSLNGSTWAPRTPPDGLGPIAVGTKGIVTGGENGNMNFSDDSATSWSTQKLPKYGEMIGVWPEGDGFAGTAVYQCCYGETGGPWYYDIASGDGLHWTMTPQGAVHPTRVAHGPKVSIAEATWDLAVRESSSDAWKAGVLPYTQSVRDVAFGANVFVVVGAGLLRFSEDGRIWHTVDALE